MFSFTLFSRPSCETWLFQICLVKSSATETSIYSGSLTSSSPMFTRPEIFLGYYYYQANQVAIACSGNYSFISNSSVNMYGYLYLDSFDPSNPAKNLISSDGGSAIDRQFRLSVHLIKEFVYLLIVTTYNHYVTAGFSVIISGPSLVIVTAFTPM